MKICLDAGHYAKYNQSPVVKEYYESDMVWKLHLYLKEELETYKFDVITTRTEQAKDLGLYDRGYKSKGCDLFLSLHSNACGTESVNRVVVIANQTDDKYAFDEISREIGDLLGKTIRDTMGVKEYRVITKKSSNDRDGNGIFDDEYYGVLNGAKAARTPSMILEHSFHTNTAATKWLLIDDNLRKLAKAEAKVIAEYFGQVKTETNNKISVSMTEKEIWDALMNEFNNAYGVAGLLGNIKAESNLKSTNLQQTYEKKLGFTDDSYTTAVDNGNYTNFIKDSAGYGLAQWTYWSRKENLLNYANSVGHSIGSCKMQVEFLIKELKGYTTVYNTLKNAKSVREASDSVLTGYERPADQGEAVQVKRATYGQEFYNKYVIKEEPKKEVEEIQKWYRVRLSWDNAKSQIGAYAVLDNAKAACKEGYTVYDWNGNAVYSNKKEEVKPEPVVSEYTTGLYKVNCELNIRKGPGTNYDKVGCIKDNGTYTIVEVQNGHWGKLKSGAGWISIHKNYCTKKGTTTEANKNQQNTTTKTNELKVGAKCKIKNGAKTYDNTKTFKSFVYKNTYNIISIKGDRVVFGIGQAVTGAIHKDNIILL